ncbi:MAG: superoxide dismutase [Actinomycetota bacterium]
MAYTLPDLPYDYSALEPHIDAQTMEIHHTKHHQKYIDTANEALSGTEWADKPVEEVLRNLGSLPTDIRTKVRNNAGGHANHSLFWTVMGPDGGGDPSGAVANAINDAFGSFKQFQEKFTETGVGQFGSGWAWLVVDGGKLDAIGLPNQDSPVIEGKTPILGIDVWEHAYYLKYQNKRPDYIEAWWNTVNWDEVNRRFEAAK